MLPDGQAGEVVIRGRSVMSGYVNNPEATAQAFFGDWFRTGDLGVLKGGYLYLEGRLKEMILRGGENISPLEIEQVLLAHPAVRDAVCFGVADDKYGELVGAAVTLSGQADAAQLIDHCRQQLAGFKVPASVRILDEIPADSDRQGAAPAGGRVPRRAGRVAVRFVVVGAGAIGAYVGAALARGGADVTLVARGAHLAAMKADGVRVLSPRGDFVAHPPVTDDLAVVAGADVVFVGLKAYSLTELAPRLGELLAPGAAAIWAQNGIPWWYQPGLESVDPGGVIAASIRPEHNVGCVVYCSTEIIEPGVIRHIEGTRFTIGEPDGAASERCRRSRRRWRRAGCGRPWRSGWRIRSG